MIRRRKLIASVATTATATSLAACAGPAGMTAGAGPSTPATYVLVHGAWHGGWCWARVRDRLNAAGNRVFTPTLTGLADRRHLLTPDTDLQTHVTDVVNLIKFESLESVVLVGHSYAGVVISQVVEKVPEAVGSIVYLDAFMPENGRSLLDDAIPATREATMASARASGPANTVRPIPSAAFKVNPADQAMVDAKCTPQPFKTFTDKLELTGARERVPKKAYIRAGLYSNPAFDACLQAKESDRSWRTARVSNAGHDVMLDAPDELTRLLMQFA